MTPSHASCLVRALFLSFAAALCAGCFKPAAQAQADRLASQMRSEPACAQTLRQWFVTIESARPSQRALPIPGSLQSEWWRGAQAYAVWSKDGKLQRISVAHGGPWEPFLVIGRPGDTADTLGLTQKAGEPSAFYAEIADGTYTCSVNYK
jgi:hypothetical protein